jgi:hypothetical protein
VAEEHHQQRQGRWREERRARALHGAGSNLDFGRVGQAGGQRAGGEDSPADGVSMMTMNCASAMTARAVQRRGLSAGGMSSPGASAPVMG